jgi:hypothetical protein
VQSLEGQVHCIRHSRQAEPARSNQECQVNQVLHAAVGGAPWQRIGVEFLGKLLFPRNYLNLRWRVMPAKLNQSRHSMISTEQDRILVTHDRQTMPWHFAEFLMSGRSCPGVFVVSQHAPISEVIDALMLIWAASAAEESK